jgi:hypothetical protein
MKDKPVIPTDLEGMQCPACGYDLRGLHKPVCPECGRAFYPKDFEKPRWIGEKEIAAARWFLPLAGCALIALLILLRRMGAVGYVPDSASMQPWTTLLCLVAIVVADACLRAKQANRAVRILGAAGAVLAWSALAAQFTILLLHYLTRDIHS